MSRSLIRAVAAVGLAAALAASCRGLDIENLNEPDRGRALAQPQDLEALIGGTFGVFFTAVHNNGQTANLFPILATEMTGVPTSGGGWSQGMEPRPPYENTPSIPQTSGPIGPRQLWTQLLQIASSVHDGLRTLDETGVVLYEEGVDVTDRARAFAKFMQGLAWGYLAMLYDRVEWIPESVPLRADIVQQAVESLTPAQEVRAHALASLDEAIAIAQSSDFTFPAFPQSRLWFGTLEPMSNEEFARLANTVAARILVLSARNPEEREQVDWQRVLAYTANGVSSDFEAVLAAGFRSSVLFARAQTFSAGCENCYRLDNRLIGLADVSGAYQEWISSPITERTRFDIVTPDRRITGATPQSDGAYTRYLEHDNGFPDGRGLYRRSAYQWARHAHAGFQSNTGTARLVTVDENNLLRAEALLRTGNAGEAAALVNITRTRAHTLPDGVTYPGLPPVTAAGVPESATCVPRTDQGECGDLLVALRYERMLELIATDAIRGYADSRGFGILPEGTWLQLPVPGPELELLGLPIYTHGGIGSEWGAVYAPVTME